jgi:hypothetical protein
MSQNNATTTTTTTAVVLWNAEAEASVKKLVEGGYSVPKSLVMAAPKGFISGVRKQRRQVLMGNSARIQGELTQQGFVICDRKSLQTAKTGDQSIWVRYMKPVDGAEKLATTLGINADELAKIRAAIAKGTVTV